MGTKILNRCDEFLMACLVIHSKEKKEDFQQVKRRYLLPFYLKVLCKQLGDKAAEFDLILYKEVLAYLSVIEKISRGGSIPFSDAIIKVYYVLSDDRVSEKAVPILNEMAKYYLFGDLIFEQVVPQHIMEKANNKIKEAVTGLWENDEMPQPEDLTLKNQITELIKRMA